MEITTETVEKTVLEFYRSSGGGSNHNANGTNTTNTTTNTQECHQWLTMAQLSPAAWTFSWDLITPEKAHEVQFFGASSLAIKLSRFWNEIPPGGDHYENLRKRLLNLLIQYRGPKIVITRLCVAVSSVVIHSVPEHWPNPIQDLIDGFRANFSPDNMAPLGLLLELLTVIPEEFGTMVMPTPRRAVVRSELTRSLEHIIALIAQVLNVQPDAMMPGEISLQAIKCFQSWVQFGVPMDRIQGLIEKILIAVRSDDELFDCSLDALSSIVSHPDTHKYPATLKALLQRILPLDQLLYQFLQEGSFEMATPLVSLFITFGESHSRLLLDWSTESQEGRDVTLRLINVILSVSACPAQYPTQETLSEMPFGFWYIFQDDIIACEPPQFEQCITIYSPIYSALVDSLLKKSMYKLDDAKWTADQRESFRCYRTDIADTIMYCYNILRNDLLQNLLNHLETSISQNLAQPDENWPYLEATLYAWSAIAESMVEEVECPLLSHFLSKLPVIPYNNNMKVVSTALDCIGGFAEWLDMHPQLLPHVTPIVTTALLNPGLALCATMALKDMSRDCAEGMKPYADEVIDACTRALNSNQLETGECIRLMYPIGKMLTLLPYERILSRLDPILTPHLHQLQNIIGLEPSQQIKPKVIFYLKMLMSLFSTLDIRKEDERAEAQQTQRRAQPIASIFPQILPMLRTVAEKWALDSDVTESECNLMKQAVSTLLDEVKPFVQDIISITLICYQSQPQGAALDLSRQFFVMFGKETQLQPILHSLLMELCNRTLREIQTTGNLSDHTDLIGGFFQMMSQVLKKQPNLLSQDESCVLSLFNCATVCLALPEVGPVKYSSQFLGHYIAVSRDFPILVNVINAQGENLFMQTLKCIGGEAARSFTDYYADILLSFNKKYFDNLCRWMNQFLATENFPTDKVTRQQKEHFAQLVLKERANKRKLLDIVREFSLACSGLIGTEYAAHMGQVMVAWDRAEDHEAIKRQQKAAATAAAAAAAAAAAGGGQN